jgi:hypothetical protein
MGQSIGRKNAFKNAKFAEKSKVWIDDKIINYFTRISNRNK